MAPARTRTLELSPCVGPIASSRKGHELSNVVFISRYMMKLVRPKIWDDWTLLLGAPVLRFSIFYEFFFTKSQKKITFFFNLIENKFALIFSLIGKNYFFASPGRFFWWFSKIFDDFLKIIDHFFNNFNEFFYTFWGIFFKIFWWYF